MGFSFCSLIRRLPIILTFCAVYYGLVHPAQTKWLRLTQENFTSEIQKHSHVLCIATVPWCGESRKTMGDVAKAIEEDEALHSLVKLRVVYVNLDTNLGSKIAGKRETPSLSLYVQSIPFKYNGKLRVQNILAGIHRAASKSSSEFPFQRLESASEVNKFMQFTDRAVIVFDNCNYAERLAKKQKKFLEKDVNTLTSESSYNMENEEILVQSATINRTGEGEQHKSDGHVGQALTLKAQAHPGGENVLQEAPMVDFENLYIHDMEIYGGALKKVAADNFQSSWNASSTEKSINRESDSYLMGCEPEINPSSSFFISSFPGKNTSSASHKSDSCNELDFKRFTVLYKNLTTIARAHVLTPERMNFGIIRNQSVLAELKIYRSQRYKWFLIVQMADQPNMPQVYFDDEAMESLTSRSAIVVPELDHDIANYHSSLNGGNPTAILFIDRASPSIEVRKRCWEALEVFRSVVRDYMGTSKNDLEGDPLTHSAKHLAVEDNFKEIRSENQVYILDPELKKEVSNIILNIRNTFSSDGLNADTGIKKDSSENENNLNLQLLKGDGNIVVKVLLDDELKMQLPKTSSGNLQALDVKNIRSAESKIVYKLDHETIVQKVRMGQPNLVDATIESIIASPPVSLVEQNDLEKIGDSDYISSMEIMEESSNDVQDISYLGSLSYFFVDGEDRMKDMILPGHPYPSLVILDPSAGAQFLFPLSDHLINSSYVKNFINEFGRRTLPNNYLSQSSVKNPRIQVQPPFVNRDFHEINGVPRVTTKTLLDMLEGRHTQKDRNDHAWTQDLLVLFTIPSCGFCERMELVFREVHRLLSLQLREVRHFCRERNFREDPESCWSRLKDDLPVPLQIDCTLNDCAPFFHGPYQQSYPSIMLFSDSERYSPVIFEGRPVVNEILDFIASRSNIHPETLHILQGTAQGQVQHHSFPSQSVQLDSTPEGARHVYYFAEDAKQDVTSSDISSFEVGNEDDHRHVDTGTRLKVGSLLVATEKISSSKTFEQCIILIVKADVDQGFQGLILNKPISWDLLHWLDKTVEAVVNKTVLCYGGPIVTYEQPFLSLSAKKDLGGFSEVVPGLFFGDVSATEYVFTLIRSAELDPTELSFFLGYAGWTWQQLLDELALGMWELTDYEKGAADLSERVSKIIR